MGNMMIRGGSDSSASGKYGGLQKLQVLSEQQFAVVSKYPCVRCKNFGFNIYSHYWECDLRLSHGSMIGELCKSFVRNVTLMAF
jgi:hypothetical protein